MITLVKPLQPLKAYYPILVTEFGIVIVVKPLQLAKVPSLILITLLGIVILVKLSQLAKAPLPILVTLFGIVIFVKPLQLAKAVAPILVTLLGITVFSQPLISEFDAVSIIALQFYLESYIVLSLSTTMLVKPLQTLKALAPIFVTLFGIVTLVKLLQL